MRPTHTNPVRKRVRTRRCYYCGVKLGFGKGRHRCDDCAQAIRKLDGGMTQRAVARLPLDERLLREQRVADHEARVARDLLRLGLLHPPGKYSRTGKPSQELLQTAENSVQ
jgi:hypothetical protein